MSKRLFLRKEILAALESARHITAGVICAKALGAPEAVPSLRTVQAVYEAELERLLDGKVSLKQKQAFAGPPGVKAPFCGDWSHCVRRAACGGCAQYRAWREKTHGRLL